MKGTLLILLGLVFNACGGDAGIIAQWDFNSSPPDGDVNTGTTALSQGVNGGATPVGSVTTSFVTGDTRHDPAGTSDNSGWRTTKYPAAQGDNKSAGVRFDVDTTGYENISLSWYQQHSATASRYLRLQYTLDGFSFNDADSLAIYVDGVFTNIMCDLAGVAGAANNPAFGFQIVAEWESSATGAGSDAYLATKGDSKYGGSGAIRFDLVTVSGTPIPGANEPPSISSVSNQVLRVNQSSEELEFIISDAEDPADSLTVAVASADPSVLPENNLRLGGSGNHRTVTLNATEQTGSALISLSVTDTGGRTAGTSFTVLVLPANTSPEISPMPTTNTRVDTPTPPLPVTVGDGETSADDLTLFVISSNTVLVPESNILLGGSGSNRTMVVTPAPGQTGVAPIRVIVSDGTNQSGIVFPVLVTPSSDVLFCDGFDYPNGSLQTNSAYLWTTRSGTAGQCQVENGQLLLCATQSEDVVARLIGAPYTKSNSTVLYAAFRMHCLSLPNPAPGLFAHFADGSTLRGRIYAGTTNAADGYYRLQVANGAGAPVELPVDLDTNTTYQVVMRYDIDAAQTMLWLNPSAEADVGVSASDPQNPTAIASYDFRQDTDLGGTLSMDDLKVGLSFAAVVETSPVIPGTNSPPNISRISDQVLRVNQSSGELEFIINDAEDAADNLTVAVASSDPAVLPEDNLWLGGSGDHRTVTVNATEQTGSALISLSVTDSGGKTAGTSFTVLVLPANTPPEISPIPVMNTLVDTPTPPVPFTVDDTETPAEDLTLSAISANPVLVPEGNILLGGSGSNRTIVVTPALGQTGVATVRVTVSDGTNQNSIVFPVMVTLSTDALLCDGFDYPNGSLRTNSAFLWTTRSGTADECQVENGQLRLCATQSEDVVARLIGAPYTKGHSVVLYASFKMHCLSLPNPVPGLLAHFADGSTLRGRVYVGTTNAADGYYRLQVANGAGTPVELTMDLDTDTTYQVVTRYDIDASQTTLWLNPSAETDGGVSANDPQSPTGIVSYDFRQDDDVGATLLIDDLKVGLSFQAVVETKPVIPCRLSVEWDGSNVRLVWLDGDFVLESAPMIDGPYAEVPGATSPYITSPDASAGFFRMRSR